MCSNVLMRLYPQECYFVWGVSYFGNLHDGLIVSVKEKKLKFIKKRPYYLCEKELGDEWDICMILSFSRLSSVYIMLSSIEKIIFINYTFLTVEWLGPWGYLC